jgi:two-component system OmpR family response regulator
LAAGGYRILEAADGQEALDVLDAEAVDLMLLDIMMPRVDGWEVLRRLGPDITTPTVVVTAHYSSDGGDAVSFLELGAVDVVTKPPDMQNMLDLVESLLDVDEAERQEHRHRRLAELRGDG